MKMKLLRVLAPVLIALLLFGLSWLMMSLPFEVSIFIRVANGFVIITLLIWVILRVLRYEGHLVQHQREIIALIELGERNRTTSLIAVAEQTAAIAQQLAAETALKAAESTTALTQKIDAMLTNGHIKAVEDVEKKVDAVHSVVTETQDTVGHLKDELTNGRKERDP